MPGSNISCPQCGSNNALHRLWCQQCTAPLPQQVVSLQFSAPRADASREKLYQQIITDLNSLRDDLEVNDAIYETISAFYQQQLTQYESERLERERIQVAHECLAKARKAGHNAQYQLAISLLQEAIAKHQPTQPLEDALAELMVKQSESTQADQLARQVEDIVRQAQCFIHDKKFGLAKAKLEQAQQLDPLHLAHHSAWKQVEEGIAEEVWREIHEGKAGEIALATDEDIVVATVVYSPGAESVGTQAFTDGTTDKLEAVPSEQVVEHQVPVALIPQPMISTSFAEEVEEPTNPAQRFIDATSKWSSVLKPFLLDNVGWFVGAFLVVAGFGILIVTFWSSIEQNQILMHSLVYASLAVATGAFFSTAYFMRLKYPELESSSNVLLVIVTLLIPLVFAAALLTSMIPSNHTDALTPRAPQRTASARFGQAPLQAPLQANSSNHSIVISS